MDGTCDFRFSQGSVGVRFTTPQILQQQMDDEESDAVPEQKEICMETLQALAVLATAQPERTLPVGRAENISCHSRLLPLTSDNTLGKTLDISDCTAFGTCSQASHPDSGYQEGLSDLRFTAAEFPSHTSGSSKENETSIPVLLQKAPVLAVQNAETNAIPTVENCSEENSQKMPSSVCVRENHVPLDSRGPYLSSIGVSVSLVEEGLPVPEAFDLQAEPFQSSENTIENSPVPPENSHTPPDDCTLLKAPVCSSEMSMQKASNENTFQNVPYSKANTLQESPLSSKENILQDVSLSSKENILQEVPVSSKENMLQEVPLSSKENTLQEVSVSSKENTLQEVSVSSKENTLQEVSLSSKENTLQEVSLSSKENTLQEVPLSSKEDTLQEMRLSSIENLLHEVSVLSMQSLPLSSRTGENSLPSTPSIAFSTTQKKLEPFSENASQMFAVSLAENALPTSPVPSMQSLPLSSLAESALLERPVPSGQVRSIEDDAEHDFAGTNRDVRIQNEPVPSTEDTLQKISVVTSTDTWSLPSNPDLSMPSHYETTNVSMPPNYETTNVSMPPNYETLFVFPALTAGQNMPSQYSEDTTTFPKVALEHQEGDAPTLSENLNPVCRPSGSPVTQGLGQQRDNMKSTSDGSVSTPDFTSDASNTTSYKTGAAHQKQTVDASEQPSAETASASSNPLVNIGKVNGVYASEQNSTQGASPASYNIGKVKGPVNIADQMSITYIGQQIFYPTHSDPVFANCNIKQYTRGKSSDPNVVGSSSRFSDVDTDAERTDSRTSRQAARPVVQQAERILLDKGRLFLCGEPGSGKTTLGEELCQRLKEQDFVVTTLDRLSCHGSYGQYVLWVDGGLGEVAVNTDQLRKLKEVMRMARNHPEMYGRVLVLVSVYKHVLLELRNVESGPDSLIPEDGATVMYLTQDPANPDVTFTPTVATYFPLLRKMVHEQTTGNKVVALLALSMMGLGNFLHEENRIAVEEKLQSLNLKASSRGLESLACVLKGSILDDTAPGFAGRVLYNTAGLVLGHSQHLLPVLLKACDAQFLLDFVRVRTVDKLAVLDADSLCSFDNISYCAEASRNSTSSDASMYVEIERRNYPLLFQKLHDLAVSGDLQVLCQHPALHCPAFLDEFTEWCKKKVKSWCLKNLLQQLVVAVDKELKHPLLYWAVWSSSDHLLRWSLALTVEERLPFKKNRLTHAVLSTAFALALLSPPHDAKASTKRVLHQLLGLNFKVSCEKKLTLKLPTPTRGISDDVKNMISKRIEELKRPGCLCYLDDPSFPIPPSLLTVTVTEEAMEYVTADGEAVDTAENDVIVELAAQHWYLALRLLTDQEVDEGDREGNTVLHTAVEAQHQDALELIVKSGALLTVKNKAGHTPYELGEKQAKKRRSRIGCVSKLHEACQSGNFDDVRRHLCTSGTVLDKHGKDHNTPLHVACKEGHVHVVSLLLQVGAKVNAVNRLKRTPLHVACGTGHLEICALLVEHGADLNMKADCTMNALHVACHRGHLHVAAFLLERGINVNATGFIGRTALHEACSVSHREVVSHLLQCGATVNCRDGFGRTPLHIVVDSHKHSTEKQEIQSLESLVQLLLEHKADVHLKNERGWSCLELSGEATELRRVLLRYSGADAGAATEKY